MYILCMYICRVDTNMWISKQRVGILFQLGFWINQSIIDFNYVAHKDFQKKNQLYVTAEMQKIISFWNELFEHFPQFYIK